MSDLIEGDIEIRDEAELPTKYLYAFTFVGIIIIEGRVLKCYPKYLFKSINPVDGLKQIIQVLQKYTSKERIIRMYNEGDKSTTFNKLTAIIFLLYDYYKNGVYMDIQDIIETNGF